MSIKYYKSNSDGIIEKHTIELIDIAQLEKEKAILEAEEMIPDLTQEDMNQENARRAEIRQSRQKEIDDKAKIIAEAKKVSKPAPAPIEM